MKNISPRHRHNFIHIVAAILGIFCMIGVIVIGIYNHGGIQRVNESGKSSSIREGEHGSEGVVSGNDNTGSELVEEPEATEELYALESFGDYLEELYTEGRRTELDDWIISTKLDLEEAALLAEKSPLLEHFRWYAENEQTVATRGICILSADVNGDGVEDVIEYGRGFDSKDKANMLNIYLGTGDGSFTLSYAQCFFDTWVQWSDIIEVARYGGETYLLLSDRDFTFYWHEENQQSRITAYRISSGKPEGKLELNWSCSDISVVIAENMGVCDISFLEENRMELYHAVNRRHCNVDTRDWSWLWFELCGSGETSTSDRQNEEVFEALDKGYIEKYTAEQRPYVEKYDGKIKGVLWNILDMFESDINNDGIMEKYLKRNLELCLYETRFSGYGGYAPFMTGEYYGIHEGRYGLTYYMESDGEETDFLEMCGLDLWEGEMTPQYFWVEQTDKGNVTYIVYQDGDEYRQLIEGYLIQGNRYERVVSAEYIPEIECSIAYEATDESDGVDYIVHCSKDGMSFELEWDSGNDRGKSLNQNIRELLEKKREAVDLQGGEFYGIMYEPIEATEEKFIADCQISYWIPRVYGILRSNPMEVDHEDYEEHFRVCINILTGECMEIEDD